MASAIRSTRIFLPRSRRCRRPAASRSGFDRLVMLATGAARIDQVLWTSAANEIGIQHTAHDRRALRRSALAAARQARCACRSGGALCGGAHAGDGGSDRPRRSGRSDRAAIRARCARARAKTGRTRRSDRRRSFQPGRRRGAPLSRSRASENRQCLRGLLPLLLPPRNGRAGAGRALGRGACCGARLYREPSADLGSDPFRRRSADPFGAAASTTSCGGLRPFLTYK